MPHEQSPSHTTLRQVYEESFGDLVDVVTRISAGLQKQYRLDRPRTWEHVAKQEELLAALLDAVGIGFQFVVQ